MKRDFQLLPDFVAEATGLWEAAWRRDGPDPEDFANALRLGFAEGIRYALEYDRHGEADPQGFVFDFAERIEQGRPQAELNEMALELKKAREA